MVQVHVPQGVGVRVPPWAPKHKRSIDENQSAFCVLETASKAPARLAGGTRRFGLARPNGVAARDRVPPWAPKHKRSIDENQSAFCVLGTASISRANSPCSSRVSPQVAAPAPHVPRTATDQAPRRSYLAKPVCACLATASSQTPGLQFFFRLLSTASHQAATRPASHLAR